MNNLISAQEAFNAVVAGKHVLCRAAGDMLDFDDLDQFPATIFAKPGYEFCIKIDEITINGYTFLKPYSLDELTDGQDVFLIGNTGSILKGHFFSKYDELVLAVKNGSVQRDFDSAQKQAKAIQELLGVDNQLVVKVVDFQTFMSANAKPKAPRKTKAKETAPTANEDAPISNDVEKQEIESNKVTPVNTDSTKITAVSTADLQEDNLITFESVKADLNLEKSLRERIVAAQSIVDLDTLLPELNKLHGESGHVVMSIFSKKKEQLSINDLKKLTADAENLVTTSKAKSDFMVQISKSENTRAVDHLISAINEYSDLLDQDKTDLVSFANLRKQDIINAEYDEKLDDLMYRASIAKTPAEANALIRYTSGWTEEQTVPLHRAISKRLAELNKGNVTEPAPSLMRDIQNAQDLTELDALEIDVSSRAPDMQKVLMAEVVKRRFELENS